MAASPILTIIFLMSNQKLPFFNILSSESQKKCDRLSVLLKRPAQQIIYLCGETSGYVYFLLEGYVKILMHNGFKREATIAIFKPGELFGETSAILQKPFEADAMTLSDCEIAALPAKLFLELIATEHQASLFVTKILSNRTPKLYRYIQVREATSTERITDAIIMLEDVSKDNGLKITHQLIADLTGLARETVTKSLLKLQKKGIVEQEYGKVTLIAD